jgi:hypothetical protein
MKMAAIDEVKVLDRCADTIEHLPLSKINGFEARSHPFPACWWEGQQNTVADMKIAVLMMLRHGLLVPLPRPRRAIKAPSLVSGWKRLTSSATMYRRIQVEECSRCDGMPSYNLQYFELAELAKSTGRTEVGGSST